MTSKYEHRIRCDKIGKLRMMASSEGYVMVRRSGCAPFVMDAKTWLALPTKPAEKSQTTDQS
jgi:hypothetical protein